MRILCSFSSTKRVLEGLYGDLAVLQGFGYRALGLGFRI